MPRPIRVFLCHSSKDKSAVRELYKKLRAETWIDPWLDEEKLFPGQDWHEEIEKAVEATDVVVVLLSKQSVSQEGYVQRELKLALDVADEKPENTIFIIPLRLDDCPAPRRLRGWHYVDYFPANRKDWVMERLIASLKLRAEALGIENTAFETKNSVQEKAEQEAKEKLVAARKAALEKEKREVQRRKQREFITANFRWLGIGGIILFVLICGGFGLNYFIKNLPVPTATPVILPSAILKPVTPTPDDMVMVYVPEGTFTMGDDSNPPIHAVYLDAFWIDQTEVTNKQYKACVDAGTCEPPSDTSSNTRPNYYGNLEFDNYPVLYVNWDKANRYCEVWKKGDLPTEAQWEKAARGTDGRTYPWGNEAPSSDLLNYYQNVNDTTKVKNYPNTKSFYGTYDMAGNVWEWVNDWYGATYYKDTASSNNPLGPEAGQQRVLRGGSWYYLDFNVRSAIRNWVDPSISNYYVGFRCARSLP